MNKTVLGFVAAALFILAGIFQIVANKPILGTLFIVLAVANVIITLKLKKISNNNK